MMVCINPLMVLKRLERGSERSVSDLLCRRLILTSSGKNLEHLFKLLFRLFESRLLTTGRVKCRLHELLTFIRLTILVCETDNLIVRRPVIRRAHFIRRFIQVETTGILNGRLELLAVCGFNRS